MEIGTPMGPGFFIFFQNEEVSGGSGHPGGQYPIIFTHDSEEKKTRKKIKKQIKKVRKIEPNVFTGDSIKKITDALVKDWNPQPSISELEISYEEALRRFELYIEIYIQQLEDEEIALLLIFANI